MEIQPIQPVALLARRPRVVRAQAGELLGTLCGGDGVVAAAPAVRLVAAADMQIRPFAAVGVRVPCHTV